MSKQLLLTLVLAAGTFAAFLSSPVAAQQKHTIVISGEGVKGRYVRLYSKGNTANEMNHYTEVEVFGK